MISKARPVWAGIGVGGFASIAFGLGYIVVLQEPGSAFYPFAGLTFLGGSFIGGIVAASKAQHKRLLAFIAATAAVFGIAFVLFVITYAVLPQFARTTILLPPYCNGYDGDFHPPARLTYALPGEGTGILITSDKETAVVALVDPDPPYSSSVYLVNLPKNEILLRMKFLNDVVSASIGKDTAYIYNDKIGYFIDTHTGELEQNIFTMDNFGGLSQTDRPIVSGTTSSDWFMETSAVISSWNKDGTVVPRPNLIFNSIARGCFISGDSHEVIRY